MTQKLLMGNEALAHAALEAGVRVAAGYPGTPSSEVIETIAALHAAQLDCKIMVGGAVLTPEYAEKIGADWYAKDAKRSADIAKEFFGV